MLDVLPPHVWDNIFSRLKLKEKISLVSVSRLCQEMALKSLAYQQWICFSKYARASIFEKRANPMNDLWPITQGDYVQLLIQNSLPYNELSYKFVFKVVSNLKNVKAVFMDDPESKLLR